MKHSHNLRGALFFLLEVFQNHRQLYLDTKGELHRPLLQRLRFVLKGLGMGTKLASNAGCDVELDGSFVGGTKT